MKEEISRLEKVLNESEKNLSKIESVSRDKWDENLYVLSLANRINFCNSLIEIALLKGGSVHEYAIHQRLKVLDKFSEDQVEKDIIQLFGSYFDYQAKFCLHIRKSCKLLENIGNSVSELQGKKWTKEDTKSVVDDIINTLLYTMEMTYTGVVNNVKILSPETEQVINTGQALIRRFPKSLRFPLKLGALFFHNGRFTEAKEILFPLEHKIKNVKMNSEESYNYLLKDYYYYLGHTLIELNEYLLAKKYFEEAIEEFPEKPSFYSGLAVTLYGLGLYKESIRFHKEALRREQDSEHKSSFLNNLGAVYMSLKEFRKAESCFRSVIRMNPDDIGAYVNLGIANTEKGLLEEGIKYYLIALSKTPKIYSDVRSLRYGRENLKGIFSVHPMEEIVSIFKKNIEENPDDLSIAYLLLDLLEQQKQIPESKLILSDIINLLRQDNNIEKHFKQIDDRTHNRVKVPIENPIAENTIIIKGVHPNSVDGLERLRKDYAITLFAWEKFKKFEEETGNRQIKSENLKIVEPLRYFKHLNNNYYSITKHRREPNIYQYFAEIGNLDAVKGSFRESLLVLAKFHALLTPELSRNDKGYYFEISDDEHDYRINLPKYDHKNIFMSKAVIGSPDDSSARLCEYDEYERGDNKYLDNFIDEFIAYLDTSFINEPQFLITSDSHLKNFLTSGTMLDFEMCCMGNPILDYVIATRDPFNGVNFGDSCLNQYLKELGYYLSQRSYDFDVDSLKNYVKPYTIFTAVRFLGTHLANESPTAEYAARLFLESTQPETALHQSFKELLIHDGRFNF